VKRRIVEVALVIFALWPLVQNGLCARYGVDPWKLFGWAMYSVPGRMSRLDLYRATPAGDGDAAADLRPLPASAIAPPLRESLEAFRQRRGALGALVSPDPLAREILRLHPELEGVGIALTTLELDRASARVVPRADRSLHWRDELQ
jgi:hypothetical protein